VKFIKFISVKTLLRGVRFDVKLFDVNGIYIMMMNSEAYKIHEIKSYDDEFLRCPFINRHDSWLLFLVLPVIKLKIIVMVSTQ
jgi:hypothetical protein